MTRHSSKSGSKVALRPTSPGLPVSSSPPDFPHPTPPADPCQAEVVRPDSGKRDRPALRDETGATAQAPAAQTPTADPVPARSAVPAQAFATAPAAEALPAQTGALMRRAQAECRELAQRMLEKVGLGDRLDYYPANLSGGQQQRAAIARSLIYRPALLLADEPTGNLDQKNSREIIDLLKLSNRSLNQTILLITHDEKIALEADRIIVIEDGRIISDQKRGK